MNRQPLSRPFPDPLLEGVHRLDHVRGRRKHTDCAVPGANGRDNTIVECQEQASNSCSSTDAVDERRHLPAVSFERVLSDIRARYLVGLTASWHTGIDPGAAREKAPSHARLRCYRLERCDAASLAVVSN